jgi:putative SOS response-associated peptidase YedK
MPLVLSAASEKIWLEKNSEEEQLMRILSTPSIKDMNYYSVSPKISEKDIDVPSLIIPTPPADQHGNLTLFD